MSPVERAWLYTLRVARPELLTVGPTPDEEQVLSEHFAYLMDLAERGRMLLFGRTENEDEKTLGLVVFEADSEQAARHIMEHDPAVRRGVMRAELFPYRVAFLRGERG